MSDKLSAALAWAERGYRVFRLLPNSAEPARKGWTEHATTNPDTIRAWWAENPHYNIGCCTTGLLVVDIDLKRGHQGLASWQALGGSFDTFCVKTRSGGYHLYYYGADVALSAGVLGDGLDIRSHHGYTIAPGSIIDGVGYEVVSDVPMRQAPADLVARCRPPGEKRENAALMLTDPDQPASIALAVERINQTHGAVQGEQSEQAYKLACAVRDRGVSEYMAGVLMDAWAARCIPPIGHEDLRGRIANAYAYAQNPGGSMSPAVQFSGVHIEPPAAAPITSYAATDWVFGNAIPLLELQPRPWVYKRLLLRRDVTALVAAGGVGKSSFTLYAAIHLALGIDMLGYENKSGRPAKSIIYDAEDSMDEMSMRLYAMCQQLDIDASLVVPMIHLRSGKTRGRVVLCNGGPQMSRDEEAMRALGIAAADPDVAMLGIGPLNSIHTCNGIDNIAMQYVMSTILAIAEFADVSVLLSHHTSKPGAGRIAGNADASQGASAVINSARIAVTLTEPDDSDTLTYGLSSSDRVSYMRLDDAKQNRALRDAAPRWMQKVGVRLWNGEEVGALQPTDMYQRSEYMRRMLAQEVRVGLTARHAGSMRLVDVAKMLKASDNAVFRALPLENIKQRLATALSDAVILEGGGAVMLDPDGNVTLA